MLRAPKSSFICQFRWHDVYNWRLKQTKQTYIWRWAWRSLWQVIRCRYRPHTWNFPCPLWSARTPSGTPCSPPDVAWSSESCCSPGESMSPFRGWQGRRLRCTRRKLFLLRLLILGSWCPIWWQRLKNTKQKWPQNENTVFYMRKEHVCIVSLLTHTVTGRICNCHMPGEGISFSKNSPNWQVCS